MEDSRAIDLDWLVCYTMQSSEFNEAIQASFLFFDKPMLKLSRVRRRVFVY